MSNISYAQNYEDVMLWRALEHIDNGFYIDVGAWSPDVDSVTRLFYEKGWHGINIEPNAELHSLYEKCRPRDISLELAVGDNEGSILINFMSNPGLSTASNEFALQHQAAGWACEKKEVKLTTLETICRDLVKTTQDIHFLKIDVEGFEAAALRGNNWCIYRPWIVVVEATLPMSQTESYEEWEPILLNANYIFAYADGLNRFYVANEHEELLVSFKYPPNVFDGFTMAAQHQAEAKAAKAEARAEQAKLVAQQRSAELHAVYASSSWRVTAPLRWVFKQLLLLRTYGLRTRLKSLLKKNIRIIGDEVLARPVLRRFLVKLTYKLGLYQHLKRLQNKILNTNSVLQASSSLAHLEAKDLASHARQIYTHLKNKETISNQGEL